MPLGPNPIETKDELLRTLLVEMSDGGSIYTALHADVGIQGYLSDDLEAEVRDLLNESDEN